MGRSGKPREAAGGPLLFCGSHEHTMDDKGRVSVPAPFRAVLARARDERLMVTGNFDETVCLVAYPVARWEALYRRIAARPRFDENVVRLKRVFVAGAAECAIDGPGRILIPPTLREYAGLEREVLWAGVGEDVEIWDKARWLAEQQRNKRDRAAIVRTLPEL